jgi:hypothetical protein
MQHDIAQTSALAEEARTAGAASVDNRIATAPSRARSLLSLFSGVPITAAPNVAQIPLDEKQNQQSRRLFFSRRKEICIEKTRNQFHVYYGHDDPTHGGYLRRVQQQLSGRVGKEVLLISVSVDPITMFGRE